MPLTINISPIILKIGIIQITYYSLVYILGFLTLSYILIKASKKKEISLSKNQVYDFIILLFISILIGARIFHILFWDFEYFSHHLKEIFYIWQGGLSFHGGFLSGIIFSYIFCRKHNLGFLRLADIIILPTTFFLAFGRIANLINSEILGKVTNSSWCINFQDIEGCRHPIQIYSAIGRLVLFAFLLKIKSKKHKERFILFIFLFLMSSGRFFLDFLREDVRYIYLSSGQWFSLVFLIVSSYILLRDYIKFKY